MARAEGGGRGGAGGSSGERGGLGLVARETAHPYSLGCRTVERMLTALVMCVTGTPTRPPRSGCGQGPQCGHVRLVARYHHKRTASALPWGRAHAPKSPARDHAQPQR